MSTNGRTRAQNVRFYVLILNVAATLILRNAEQSVRATVRDLGCAGLRWGAACLWAPRVAGAAVAVPTLASGQP